MGVIRVKGEFAEFMREFNMKVYVYLLELGGHRLFHTMLSTSSCRYAMIIDHKYRYIYSRIFSRAFVVNRLSKRAPPTKSTYS